MSVNRDKKVIKAIEFGEKTFESKEALFSALKKNEAKLISLKKSQVYKSHEKGQLNFLNLDKFNGTVKGIESAKEGYIYPIISTVNYLDSHGDVHLKGSMNKTAKEQHGKVVYALDHKLQFDNIIAWQKDVNMFITNIDWTLVGKNYAGTTEALVFEINKESISRKDVLNAIENKVSDFENSIRMVYHKISLAIDSNEKEHAENKTYFDARINEIANKEAAIEQGYFWGIEELAIHKEGSLVVAGGSNDATSIYAKEIEAAFSTSKEEEPLLSTQEKLNNEALEAERNLKNTYLKRI
jgi:hypothetical protein